ncbi:MAG: DoxX-like family protein [Flavobacteriaceae bacterium]
MNQNLNKIASREQALADNAPSPPRDSPDRYLQAKNILLTMTNRKINKILTFCFVTVWIMNGLFCKILNLVPRHEQIVARILGDDYSQPLTILIGLLEIIMAVWILSGYKTKLNAIVQILVVASMNILEFILVPDLLLWGKLNLLFAFIFILVIYYNEFHLTSKQIN